MSRLFKIFLIVVLSVLSDTNLSANDTPSDKLSEVILKNYGTYLNYFNLVRKIGDSIDKAEKALQDVLEKNNVYIKRNT